MSKDIAGSVFWPIHGSLATSPLGSLNGSTAFDSVHEALKGLLLVSVGHQP